MCLDACVSTHILVGRAHHSSYEYMRNKSISLPLLMRKSLMGIVENYECIRECTVAEVGVGGVGSVTAEMERLPALR